MPVDGDQPRADPLAFRVDVHPERDVVRVAPVGELDLDTTPELEAQLHELRRSGFHHVVLDMRGLTFIDSSGIRAIFAENQFADTSGREFSLLSGPPAIQRALEICGLLEYLHVDAP